MKTKSSSSIADMQAKIDFLSKKLASISRNAETIITSKNIHETVQHILLSIREYYNGDSAYVFVIDYQRSTIINAFETYAAGVDSEKQHTSELPFSFLEFWKKEWGLHGHLCVRDLAKYKPRNPELAAPYQGLMGSQGIHGLIYVPLWVDHVMKGFIGVDNPRTYADDVDFIITMGHYISLQLARKQREEELDTQYKDTKSFIDSIANRYLFTARINVSQDYIDNIRGTAVFPEAKNGSAYDENMVIVCQHMDPKNQAIYKEHFSRKSLLAAFAKGTDHLSAELYYRSPTGRFIWARHTAQLRQHPDTGDIIAFCYQADITREKIQETILGDVIAQEYDYIMCIHGLENTSTLISKNPDGEDSADLQDSDSYKETIRQYAEKYVEPDDRKAFVYFMDPDHLWSILETHDSCSTAFCLSINGHVRYKKLNFYCINREYRLFAHVRTDFTETYQLRQQQEEKLRNALKAARKANAAKSEFLSRMSHDIRTPLNGIIGMTALALAKTESAEARQYLEKVTVSSHVLLALVNDILDLTTIDSGLIELHPEPYNEQAFLTHIDSVIRPLCEEKQITLKMTPLNEPRWVLVDTLKYNQIFFKLLSNAIKFTPPGGHISLQCDREIKKGKLILTSRVQDNGIGMSPDFQKRLFHPFEQANKKRDDNRTGSGLGLAIVYRLVRLMKGTISVASTPGKGTTFTVRLPLPLVEPPAPSIPTVPDAKIFQDKRILIAEDNEINGDILKVLLEEKGAIVTIVHDGSQAVSSFNDSSPFFFQAILMDVRMPAMDGLTATRTIRSLSRPDAMTVPIIATTANAYSEDIQNCLEAGMNSHMSKPIETQDLYNILSWYLQEEPTEESQP